MIKNILLMSLGFLAACDPQAEGPEPFQGIVELEERVLAFEIPGRVNAIAVKEGDAVEDGAELVRLDDTLERLQRDATAADARSVQANLDLLEAGTRPEDIRSLQADLRAARTDLKLSKRQLERSRKLAASGAGTDAELDASEAAADVARARVGRIEQQLRRLRGGARDEEVEGAGARVEAAQAAVRAADERIERHVLRSDGPGIVLDVFVETGEFTGVGAPVVTVADVTHPYVDVFIPQGRIGEVSIGDPVHVSVDTLDTPFSGVVEHISRKTEFTPKFLFSDRERPNLVIRVRVRIEDPEGALRSGVPAFVDLEG